MYAGEMLETLRRRVTELIVEACQQYDTTENELLSGGAIRNRETVMAKEEIIHVLDQERVFSGALLAQVLGMSSNAVSAMRVRIRNQEVRKWVLKARIRRSCDKCGGTGSVLCEE